MIISMKEEKVYLGAISVFSSNRNKSLICLTTDIGKGRHKQKFIFSGNLYPKQETKALNITPAFANAMTRKTKLRNDRLITLQETNLSQWKQKIYGENYQ